MSPRPFGIAHWFIIGFSGKGRRLELLVVTPDSVECKPIQQSDKEVHDAVAKAIREAYSELDLVRQPVEIRSNDAALSRHLTLHLRGVEYMARHQSYWVKLEMARRLTDVVNGPCRSQFDCNIAEHRRQKIASERTTQFGGRLGSDSPLEFESPFPAACP